MPAPTLTRAELAAAMRLADGADVSAPLDTILDGMLDAGREILALYAPGAPEPNANESLVRFCGYLYDQPGFARRPMNAWRFSGAQALVPVGTCPLWRKSNVQADAECRWPGAPPVIHRAGCRRTPTASGAIPIRRSRDRRRRGRDRLGGPSGIPRGSRARCPPEHDNARDPGRAGP